MYKISLWKIHHIKRHNQQEVIAAVKNLIHFKKHSLMRDNIDFINCRYYVFTYYKRTGWLRPPHECIRPSRPA
jgi:hypothetical protein